MAVDVSFAVLLVRDVPSLPVPSLNSPFAVGISDAYYCADRTRLEKGRDVGCPKIVNLGAGRPDLFYERRRLGMLIPRRLLTSASTVQSQAVETA